MNGAAQLEAARIQGPVDNILSEISKQRSPDLTNRPVSFHDPSLSRQTDNAPGLSRSHNGCDKD
jgi:hypothetical protein